MRSELGVEQASIFREWNVLLPSPLQAIAHLWLTLYSICCTFLQVIIFTMILISMYNMLIIILFYFLRFVSCCIFRRCSLFNLKVWSIDILLVEDRLLDYSSSLSNEFSLYLVTLQYYIGSNIITDVNFNHHHLSVTDVSHLLVLKHYSSSWILNTPSGFSHHLK